MSSVNTFEQLRALIADNPGTDLYAHRPDGSRESVDIAAITQGIAEADRNPFTEFVGDRPQNLIEAINATSFRIRQTFSYRIYSIQEDGTQFWNEFTVPAQTITYEQVMSERNPWLARPGESIVMIVFADSTGQVRYSDDAALLSAHFWLPTAPGVMLGFLRGDGVSITRLTPYQVDGTAFDYVHGVLGPTNITPYEGTHLGFIFNHPNLTFSCSKLVFSRTFGSLASEPVEIAARDPVLLDHYFGVYGNTPISFQQQLNPTQWDNGGTLTPLGSTEWMVMLLQFNAATQAFQAVYGRSKYKSIDALNANTQVISREFSDLLGRAESVRFTLGALAIRGGATNLQLASDARWAPSNKIGSVTFDFKGGTFLTEITAVDTRAADPATLPLVIPAGVNYRVLLDVDDGAFVAPFAGNEEQIATTNDGGLTWTFTTANVGDYVRVRDADPDQGEPAALYYSEAEDWVAYVPPDDEQWPSIYEIQGFGSEATLNAIAAANRRNRLYINTTNDSVRIYNDSGTAFLQEHPKLPFTYRRNNIVWAYDGSDEIRLSEIPRLNQIYIRLFARATTFASRAWNFFVWDADGVVYPQADFIIRTANTWHGAFTPSNIWQIVLTNQPLTATIQSAYNQRAEIWIEYIGSETERGFSRITYSQNAVPSSDGRISYQGISRTSSLVSGGEGSLVSGIPLEFIAGEPAVLGSLDSLTDVATAGAVAGSALVHQPANIAGNQWVASLGPVPVMRGRYATFADFRAITPTPTVGHYAWIENGGPERRGAYRQCVFDTTTTPARNPAVSASAYSGWYGWIDEPPAAFSTDAAFAAEAAFVSIL